MQHGMNMLPWGVRSGNMLEKSFLQKGERKRVQACKALGRVILNGDIPRNAHLNEKIIKFVQGDETFLKGLQPNSGIYVSNR